MYLTVGDTTLVSLIVLGAVCHLLQPLDNPESTEFSAGVIMGNEIVKPSQNLKPSFKTSGLLLI